MEHTQDLNCIFCKIINKQIHSNVEYEDEYSVVFHDIHPRARIHLLIIPKKHIATIQHLQEEDEKYMGRLLLVANKMARKMNLSAYKLQINVGKEAGQEVFHIHLHLKSVN